MTIGVPLGLGIAATLAVATASANSSVPIDVHGTVSANASGAFVPAANGTAEFLATAISTSGELSIGLLFLVTLLSLAVGALWRDRAALALAALAGASLLTLLASRTPVGDMLPAAATLALGIAGWHSGGVIGIRYSSTAERLAFSALIALLPILGLVTLLQGPVGSSMVTAIAVALGIGLAGLAIALSLKGWRRGNRGAAFVMFGWLWLVVFVGLSVWLSETLLPQIAIVGAVFILTVGYVDRTLGFRRDWALQLDQQKSNSMLLRVERERRDFSGEVTELLRTLDPVLYEEFILTRFLEHLANMVPFAGAAVAVSHRGDVRLVVLGEDEMRDGFESILATREQLLQSVCLSDRAAVIHSDDLVANPTGTAASCLGIVPVSADRNEWAGVLLARSGELEFGLDELDLVSDFAHQAYDALRSAEQFRKVQRQAETDSLTGIFNRRAVMIRARRSFLKARSLSEPLSLLFVDVDHFKDVNDRWGHAVGDHALERIARICSDTVRDRDFIGRIGGEEFLCVLPGADAKDAVHVAERLRAAVEADVMTVDDAAITVTVSVGISELCDRFRDFDSMLRAADRALYRAKREGRNRVIHHRHMLRGDRVSRPLS